MSNNKTSRLSLRSTAKPSPNKNTRKTLMPVKAFGNVLNEIPESDLAERSSSQQLKTKIKSIGKRLSSTPTALKNRIATAPSFQPWRVIRSNSPFLTVNVKQADQIRAPQPSPNTDFESTLDESLDTSFVEPMQESNLVPAMIDFTYGRKRAQPFTLTSFGHPVPYKTSRLLASLDIERSGSSQSGELSLNIQPRPTSASKLPNSSSFQEVRGRSKTKERPVIPLLSFNNEPEPKQSSEKSSSTNSATSLKSFPSSNFSNMDNSYQSYDNLDTVALRLPGHLKEERRSSAVICRSSVDPISADLRAQVVKSAGLTLFNIKPVKGITYLLQNKVVGYQPSAIMKFLTTEEVSRHAMGEYFGCLNDPLADKVLNELLKNLDVKDLEIDEALRKLLRIFHPSGESQKLNDLVKKFSQSYYEQNEQRVNELFQSPDTVETISYSILMLQTDLHNPNCHATRISRKMSELEFIKNNRGIDIGNDVDETYLTNIYRRIAAHKFEPDTDLTDTIRSIDKLLLGPLKTEKFNLRYRRFVGLCTVEEVSLNPTKPKASATKSDHPRVLMVFNDLLLITKPQLPMAKVSNFLDVEGTKPSTHSPRSSSKHWFVTSSPKRSNSNLFHKDPVCSSTDPPRNNAFFLKKVISLNDPSITLVPFSSKTSKTQFGLGVTAQSATNNLVFHSEEDRDRVSQWIQMSIEELKEVVANK
ncbi:IQ motif and S7 domain-containing protein 1 [Cichlidogyrus casuarinus]|uniref:IQ motif and S7 domain-containing protein 1 n=1 Tax=Cichlidogyrus casuarinus TaxID=1844966 RepID=A0ABD2PXS3_9PLAT